jgi:hypothetical protein
MIQTIEARLKRLLEAQRRNSEPMATVHFTDGRSERMTSHRAILAAIKDNGEIDHIDGPKTGLANAILKAGRA